MNIMKIKRSHPNAKIPFYANDGDVGMDVTATSMKIIHVGDEIVLMYGTDLHVEAPYGFTVDLRSRSSIGTKTNLILTNGTGTVDEAYRGELKFCFALRGFSIPGGEVISLIETTKDGRLLIKYTNGGTGEDEQIWSVKQFLIYNIGDRIGQIVLRKADVVEKIEEVTDFLTTARNENNFGSSGK